MPVNNEILSSSIARQMLAQGARYETVMAMFRRATLSAALEFTRGHQGRAAELLGVHRNTLCRLCEQDGLQLASFRPSTRARKPVASQQPPAAQESAHA